MSTVALLISLGLMFLWYLIALGKQTNIFYLACDLADLNFSVSVMLVFVIASLKLWHVGFHISKLLFSSTGFGVLVAVIVVFAV